MQFKQSLLSRFKGLIIFVVLATIAIFGASLLPIKQSITKEQIYAATEPAFDSLSATGLPTGFKFDEDPAVDIVLANNRINLYASFTGSVFGTNESSIQFVASGRPVYQGTGNSLGAFGRTFTTGYELLSGNRTSKRFVFDFTSFNIVDETFIINGEPAIEFAVPVGQDVVEGLSNTAPGQVVTGLLQRLGRDTSNEARDAWTADTMRRHQSLLLTWFENGVRQNLSNTTLYQVGDNPKEQFVASTFGGFDLEPDAVTLRFYAGAILAVLISTIFGILFGLGYWIKRALGLAKDTNLVKLDEETIEKIGDVTDSLNSLR